VQSSLQLPARENLSVFDRMLEQLFEKSIGWLPEPIDENDYLHGWIEITQVEYGFGNIDQRTSRDQHGFTEDFMPSMIDRRLVVGNSDHLTAGGHETLFQKLVMVAADQHNFVARTVAGFIRRHHHAPLCARIAAGFLEWTRSLAINHYTAIRSVPA
jgi:hypothetical protein